MVDLGVGVLVLGLVLPGVCVVCRCWLAGVGGEPGSVCMGC